MVSTTAQMDATATLIHDEHDYTFATSGNVFIVIWRHETPPAGTARLDQAIGAFAARQSGKIGLLTIIAPDASIPARTERDALATTMNRHGAAVQASAVAFEGEGFRAAAIRSVVTGLTLVARQPFPHKIFSSVKDASAWLCPQLGATYCGSGSGETLASAVAALRSQLTP